MSLLHVLIPVVGLTLLPNAAFAARQATASGRALPHLQQAVPDSAMRARPLLATAEALAVNVIVNRVDAWVLGHDWARVRPSDWRRNLHLGWEWDEDEFGTNMFSHPYHGGLYFNAGRANGLSFWEAAPLVFFGSITWEYFGETYRPSLNDFFMTSFGGIALGEVFHRVGASIRDNGATGRSRFWREMAALPFDPMSGLNRLVRGDWSRVGPNPPEHTPDAYVFRVSAGTRVAADSGFVDRDDTYSPSPTLLAELVYGDPFRKQFDAPFDVFSVRLQLSPVGGGLNLLRASGRLYGLDLNRQEARHRHLFAVNQRYDFLRNPAHRFGAQSIEVGFYSRWRLSNTAGLRTQAFVDGIVLGALDAPYTGFGERTYDFGPGVGARFEVAFERSGITYLTLYGRSEYLHSVSGARAHHYVGFGGAEVVLPVAFNLGVGAHSGYFRRFSRYTDRAEESRDYPELRLFLVWTGSGRSPIAR